MLIFLIHSCLLTAQHTDYNFDRFSTENGLPNNQIHCILQDHQGYIWLGTSIGLVRYNGYSFTVFKHSTENTSSIGKGDVWALYEDNQSQLWVGTIGGGLNLFNREKESFTHYYKQPENGKSVNDDNINFITGDKYNNLWIGTGFGGLNCLNQKTGSFTYYKYNLNDSSSLGNNGVMSILSENKKNLWVGTWGGGLNLFDYNTKKFKRLKFDTVERTNGTSNVVWTIYRDKRNNLWLGTWGSGLIFFDEKSGKFKRFINDPKVKTSISDNVILSMTEDNFGNFWVGTEAGGLNLMDRNKETFTIPDMKGTGPNENLLRSSVYSLYNDRQGILWIGTFGQGINLWDKNKRKFILIKLNDFLQGSRTNCAFEDQSGILWIGTGEDGIIKYDRKTGNIQSLKTENTKLSSKYIFAICNLNKDHLLFSTYKGLYTINKVSGKITEFEGEKAAIKTNLVNYKGKYIFYNKNSSLIQYDIHKNSFKKLCDVNYNIQCFIISRDSNVWIGTEKNGVIKYSMVNHTITLFNESSKDKIHLNDNIIKCLYEDHAGNIWIGTYMGINKLEPKKLTLKVYEEKDGLPEGTTVSIIEDKFNNIWLSTNNGISRLNIKRNNFTSFIEQDGLPDKTPLFYRTIHNEIVMTGSKGFSIFDPAQISKNNYTPSVLITDFKLFNKSILPGSKGSPLKKHISETTSLVLNYKQSIITFNWLVINYRLPEKNQYAYKMEGFEKDWKYIGNLRSATYTNLPPGNYEFRVKASNNDGIWNETSSSLKITITPPFWNTLWFRLLIVVCLALFLYAWYRRRVWRLLAQRTILQEKVIQRTADIKRQNEILQEQKEELITQADRLQDTNFLLMSRKEELEAATNGLKAQGEELYKTNEELLRLNATKDRLFSIIAHDLKNPFNAIIGFTELLTEKFNKMAEEKKIQILGSILHSSKNAYKLLENLLEWARSQTNNIEFKPESNQIKTIISKVLRIIELQAEVKNTNIEIDIPDNLHAFADATMVETILRNLISNAVKFTAAGGKIQISASRYRSGKFHDAKVIFQRAPFDNFPNATFLKISVTDSGIGIPPEVLEQLFRMDVPHVTPGTSGELGTGLGLILCSEFSQKNMGHITVQSEVGSGSTFTLYLPENKESAEAIQEAMQGKNNPEYIEPDKQIAESILLNSEGEKYQILIVEDNPELRSYLMKNLEQSFLVKEAKNGKIGVEKAFKHIPDLIISDVMMPEMDGFDLCRTIKSDERTSHIPVILLTAKIGDENHLAGLETGANDYLMKPFNIQLLNVKIRNMLKMQERLRERYGKQLYIGPSDLPINNVNEVFIKRAIEIVEKNMDDITFNVDKLSDEFNMSRFQFYRKLNALADTTPIEFIRNIRLKRAAQLLSQGVLNINQVCYETGFNDHSYFTKCFKKEFGVLPKEYNHKS